MGSGNDGAPLCLANSSNMNFHIYSAGALTYDLGGTSDNVRVQSSRGWG